MGIYAKSSKELVYDLIMLANPQLPVKLSSTNCRVDKITAVTPSAETNYRNTKARIRGLQGDGYEDSSYVYYDRLQLGEIIIPAGKTSSKFVSYTAKSIHHAFEALYNTYGVLLNAWDVVDAALASPNVSNFISTVTLTAAATSPAYVGSVLLRYGRGRPLLEGLTQLSLPVLTHPVDPAFGKMSASMLTYGLDFTAFRSYLTVDGTGMPQWAQLRAILNTLGVPDYPAPTSATVIDALTTAVAGANTAYDRVVVHSGINSDTARGVAYYHYNVSV